MARGLRKGYIREKFVGGVLTAQTFNALKRKPKQGIIKKMGISGGVPKLNAGMREVKIHRHTLTAFKPERTRLLSKLPTYRNTLKKNKHRHELAIS